ncbi:serine/threonine protein kinase [Pseudomonas nicosulfuronedens]
MLSERALPGGHRVGDFDIVHPIGHGGFGIVYLARAARSRGPLAIKEYMPHSLALRAADGQVKVRQHSLAEDFQAGLRAFAREAQLLSELRHPALPRVWRFWQENGTAYYGMPWYPGPTFQDLVAEPRTVSPAWLENLLGVLLGALERLHGIGCLHGDIAPDNIILDAHDEPVLLDLGAAGNGRELRLLKPSYSPLELHGGQAIAQGCWSDLYSLGAVLYQLIVGQPPPSSLSRSVQDTWRPLGSLAEGSGHPAHTLAAIDRALSLHPRGRPQTVAEFAAELRLQKQGDRYRSGARAHGQAAWPAKVNVEEIQATGPG